MKQTTLLWCVVAAVFLDGSAAAILQRRNANLIFEPPSLAPGAAVSQTTVFAKKAKKPLVQRLRSEHNGVVYTGEMTIGGSLQKTIYDTGSWELVVLSKCKEAAAASALQLQEQPSAVSALQLQDRLERPPNLPKGSGWNSEACKKFRSTASSTIQNTHKKMADSSIMCCAPKHCPRGTYDPTHSSTYSKIPNSSLQAVVYGSGATVVRPGLDEVSIVGTFDKSAVSKAKVPLKVIMNHSIRILNLPGTPQAIVGIGPGNHSHVSSRWYSKLGIERFMFCFSKDPRMDGFVTWHDVDRTKDSKWQTVKVDGAVHWAFSTDTLKLTGPSAGQAEIDVGCGSGCGILVDTGASFITVPQAMLQRVVDGLNQRGIMDCSDLSKFPNLSFKLNGQAFELPPESYLADAGQRAAFNMGLQHGQTDFFTMPMTREDAMRSKKAAFEGKSISVGQCMLLLDSLPCPLPTQWGPLIIMGMPLFRTYAVQFDLSQEPARFIHLAKADSTCSKSTDKTQRDGNWMNNLLSRRPALQKVNIDEMLERPRKLASAAEQGAQWL